VVEASTIGGLERRLREAGFFEEDPTAAVADLYLGYDLSEPLLRTAASAPPPPCRLPRAAARIRFGTDGARAGRYELGAWERTWDDAGYAAAIGAVREAIRCGDVYQVNLVQHLSAPFAGSPAAVARALAPLAPLAPAPLICDGWAIVSASPDSSSPAAATACGRARSRGRARSTAATSSTRRRTPPST
jgi:hypothetical protein